VKSMLENFQITACNLLGAVQALTTGWCAGRDKTCHMSNSQQRFVLIVNRYMRSLRLIPNQDRTCIRCHMGVAAFTFSYTSPFRYDKGIHCSLDYSLTVYIATP